MRIREVKRKDKEAWAEMRSRLWPDAQDEHASEINDFFSHSSTDIVKVWVLVDDQDNAVGFLELNIRNFAEGSRLPKIPYVEAWYVAEGFRGQGHGLQLMRSAEAWARESGFTEIASDTDLDNFKSISLHKSLGFRETERIVCFLKRLNEVEPPHNTEFRKGS